MNFNPLGCVSLRKSKIGFCVSLLNRLTQDLSKKESKNPVWKWILRFLLRHHDPRDLGLVCLVKNRKIGRFLLNLTV